VFDLGDVYLQSGGILPSGKLAYKTYGQLNEEKTNVVIIPTYYTGSHKSNEPYFGSGRAIDPENYFIIVPDMFGNSVSSSPSNTPPPFDGPRFPNITIYDNVVCQHRLVVEKFKVKRIALVCGWSMGGLQSYMWAALYPDLVERIVPFCASAKCSIHNYVFLEGVKAALLADSTFEKGEKPVAGLKAFGRVYCGWAYSQEWFSRQLYQTLGFQNLEDFLKWWEDGHLDWDANDLLAMLWTWQYADISDNDKYKKNFELALSSIQSRAIVMPCSTDLYFPELDNRREVQHLKNGELRVIDSIWGHIAGGPGRNATDIAFLDQAFKEILEQPVDLTQK